MCPVCIAGAALVAAGAGSTGGLTALVARTLVRRKRAVAAPAQSTRAPELRASTSPTKESADEE